eukprot:TRINITY_DN8779_c0_g1_i2.p1 TRINITY_DN8779_c0_g1~~TRINITY_DN8779_c0_g1_i2.p1  ORF type:complete len:487 (+),score=91.36 TRINITY_DN8779_c0_g1_i2:79-1461(+)
MGCASGPFVLRVFDSLGLGRWYGVCVLCASCLGAFATAPSHSYVIGLYTDTLAAAAGAEVWHVNALWSTAMVGAAGVLAACGPCVDSLGPAAAFCCAGCTLAVAVAVLSYAHDATTMLVAFLLVRCCGSGLMLTATNKAVNSWWVRRRGFANAVAACGISAALSTPSLCLWLTAFLGWRSGLRAVAFGVAALTLLVKAVMLDNPFDHGLQADCSAAAASGTQVTQLRRVPSAAAIGMTRREATSWLIFWLVCIAAVLTDMFFVGFNLHAIAVMQERGVGIDDAGAVFISIAAAHISGTLLYGVVVVDAVRDKRKLLVANTAVACAAMLAGGLFHGMRSAHGFGVVFGAMHAMVFLSLDALLPHFFGVLHLGSISGLARGISFLGGATGPVLFDICKGYTGHFSLVMFVCAAAMALIGVLACFASDPSEAADSGQMKQRCGDRIQCAADAERRSLLPPASA